MNLRILSIACWVACSLSVGCGDDDGGGSGNLAANCQKVCSLTAPLNCPMDPADCAGNCQAEATSVAKCTSVVEAALACSATRPASDFECNVDGESELKDTACSNESAAVFTCLFGG